MSDSIFEASSFDEAIEKAEIELGIKRDDFSTEIIEEKQKGILGIRWGKKIRVKVVPNDKKIVEPPEILNKIMDLSGINGEVNTVETFDEIVLNVKVDNDTEALFIGKHGKNLDAYQYLVTKMSDNVLKEKGKRLVVDCADYRKRRKINLEGIARSAAQKVKREGVKYTFHPMQSDERRIIHMTMKEEGLVTESKGSRNARSVVVFPPN